MGKKGVLLDNGKAARSSMDLYWKAAQKKANTKGEKKEPREQDIEDRVQGGQQKWKLHKEKMINKMYEKLEKKEKVDAETEKQRERKAEEQLQRDMLEKQMNKNRPIKIPGFKNMEQLRAKMQFEQVKVGNNASNKLIPRNQAEQLDEAQIIQILREKKAKKELQRAQKQRIDKNLRQRQKHDDMMMNGLPQDRTHKLEPSRKEEPVQQPQPVEPEPENFFKSQILQKIERGEGLHKKDDRKSQKKIQEKVEQQEDAQPKVFASRFVPRALWGK